MRSISLGPTRKGHKTSGIPYTSHVMCVCVQVFVYECMYVASTITTTTTTLLIRYGAINYAAFDVANHFMEYSGGTEEGPTAGRPQYDKLPDPAKKRLFCAAYLEVGVRCGVCSAVRWVQEYAVQFDICVYLVSSMCVPTCRRGTVASLLTRRSRRSLRRYMEVRRYRTYCTRSRAI